MSAWVCVVHGVTGPEQCCSAAAGRYVEQGAASAGTSPETPNAAEVRGVALANIRRLVRHALNARAPIAPGDRITYNEIDAIAQEALAQLPKAQPEAKTASWNPEEVVRESLRAAARVDAPASPLSLEELDSDLEWLKPVARQHEEECPFSYPDGVAEGDFCTCGTQDAFDRIASLARSGIDALAVLAWLESRGVRSVYFLDGTELNPASQSLRAACINEGALSPQRSGLASKEMKDNPNQR